MSVAGVLNKKIAELFKLRNNIVYIGEQNIEHMRSKHPDEYELYYEEISSIINAPDYVGKNLLNDSIELVKEFYSEEKKCYIKVAIRMSNNGTLFAKTLYKLNDKKFEYQLSQGNYICVKKHS